MKHFIVFYSFFFLCFDYSEAQTNANIAGPENVLVIYNNTYNISVQIATHYEDIRRIS